MGKLDDICSKILNENILILLLLLVIFFKKFKIERLIRYECDLFVYLWLQRVYETLIEISTSSVTKPNYSPAFVSRPHGPNQMRGGGTKETGFLIIHTFRETRACLSFTHLWTVV